MIEQSPHRRFESLRRPVERTASLHRGLPLRARPRRNALVVCVIFGALNLLNLYSIVVEQRFWTTSLAIGPAVFLVASWRLVIGQPWDVENDREARWATAGDAACLFVGFCFSGAVVAVLNGWWNPGR